MWLYKDTTNTLLAGLGRKHCESTPQVLTELAFIGSRMIITNFKQVGIMHCCKRDSDGQKGILQQRDLQQSRSWRQVQKNHWLSQSKGRGWRRKLEKKGGRQQDQITCFEECWSPRRRVVILFWEISSKVWYRGWEGIDNAELMLLLFITWLSQGHLHYGYLS